MHRSEQEFNLSTRSRYRQSIIHPVSQVGFQIDEADATSAFGVAMKTVLDWVAKRVGQPLPEAAWLGESFILNETGAQPAEAVAIDNDDMRYWAARCDDADKRVAKRVWTAEFSLGLNKKTQEILFGGRLLCVSQQKEIRIAPSIPNCVSQIVLRQKALLDGREISTNPWIIDSSNSVKQLVNLLRNPDRSSDVIVFALPDGSKDPPTASANAMNVAKRLTGVGHVAVITVPESFTLTKIVGGQFSVFNHSVRTYRAGFDPTVDEPFDHPFATEEWILDRNRRSSLSFEDLLVGHALRRSVSGHFSNSADLPRFSDARRVANGIKRDSDREEVEELLRSQAQSLQVRKSINQMRHRVRSLERDLESSEREFKKEKDEYRSLMDDAESERQSFENQARQFKSENLALISRIEALDNRLNNRNEATVKSIPRDLDNFEEWCKDELAGSVVILNRAVRQVKDSQFEDVALVYKAMLLLRDHYVPMRRNGGKAQQRMFKDELSKLHLELTPTFSGPRQGEENERYRIEYCGQRILLEHHLKKGNSREERFCFRVYFFWDGDTRQVVIGWLPSHIRTRKT